MDYGAQFREPANTPMVEQARMKTIEEKVPLRPPAKIWRLCYQMGKALVDRQSDTGSCREI
jgi:hypothetical protein